MKHKVKIIILSALGVLLGIIGGICLLAKRHSDLTENGGAA